MEMRSKQNEAKGLLAVWADIEEDYRITFKRWHNCEHVPERVNIPGFYVGRRYRGMDNDGHYLMFYETSNSKVLGDKPYLHSLNHPTPRTREAVARFINPARAIFSLLARAGEAPLVDSPHLYVMRFNSPSKAIAQWHENEYLPQLCAMPGVYRGRLYEVDPETSGIVTTERKIYSPRQGEQRFLLMVEIASPELPGSKAWQELPKRVKEGEAMLKGLEDIDERVYWLDFSMYAPRIHPQ
jgi:hypothetical protein